MSALLRSGKIVRFVSGVIRTNSGQNGGQDNFGSKISLRPSPLATSGPSPCTATSPKLDDLHLMHHFSHPDACRESKDGTSFSSWFNAVEDQFLALSKVTAVTAKDDEDVALPSTPSCQASLSTIEDECTQKQILDTSSTAKCLSAALKSYSSSDQIDVHSIRQLLADNDSVGNILTADQLVTIMDIQLESGEQILSAHDLESRLSKCTSGSESFGLAQLRMLNLYLNVSDNSGDNTVGFRSDLDNIAITSAVVRLYDRLDGGDDIRIKARDLIYETWLTTKNWTGLEWLSRSDVPLRSRLCKDLVQNEKWQTLSSVISRTAMSDVNSVILPDVIRSVQTDKMCQVLTVFNSSCDDVVPALTDILLSMESGDCRDNILMLIPTDTLDNIVDASLNSASDEGCIIDLLLAVDKLENIDSRQMWTRVLAEGLSKRQLNLAHTALKESNATALLAPEQVVALLDLAQTAEVRLDIIASVAKTSQIHLAIPAVDRLLAMSDFRPEVIQNNLIQSKILHDSPAFFGAIIDRLLVVEETNVVVNALVASNPHLVDFTRHGWLLPMQTGSVHQSTLATQIVRFDDICAAYRSAGQYWNLQALLDRPDLQASLTVEHRQLVYMELLNCYINLGMLDAASSLSYRLAVEGLEFVEFSTTLATFQQHHTLQPATLSNRDGIPIDLSQPPPVVLQQYRRTERRPQSVTDKSNDIEKLVRDPSRLDEAAKLTIEMLRFDRSYPIPKVFRFLLNRLASNGHVDHMLEIGELITASVKKEVSFDNRLCNAFLSAGRGEEFLDMLVEDLRHATDSNLDLVKARFPRGGALGLLEAHPECVEKFTDLAHAFLVRGYIAPLNVLWTYHFIRGNRQVAADLWLNHVQHCPQIMFQKVCQTARQNGDVAMAADLVELLRDAASVTDGARGIAYSCLLDVHSTVGDFIGGLERLRTGVESGDVSISKINRTALVRLRDGIETLAKTGIPVEFPYQIPHKKAEYSETVCVDGAECDHLIVPMCSSVTPEHSSVCNFGEDDAEYCDNDLEECNAVG